MSTPMVQASIYEVQLFETHEDPVVMATSFTKQQISMSFQTAYRHSEAHVSKWVSTSQEFEGCTSQFM